MNVGRGVILSAESFSLRVCDVAWAWWSAWARTSAGTGGAVVLSTGAAEASGAGGAAWPSVMVRSRFETTKENKVQGKTPSRLVKFAMRVGNECGSKETQGRD